MCTRVLTPGGVLDYGHSRRTSWLRGLGKVSKYSQGRDWGLVQRGEDHWEGLVQRKEQHLWRSRGSDVWAQDFLPTFTSLLWLISYWATERALFLHAWGALAVRQQCVVSSGHGLSAETCLDAIAAGDPMEDRCRQLAWHVDLAGCKLIELGMFDSSTALWEVMKQHLWVWEISFKWQWTKSFKLLSQAGLAWRARRSSWIPVYELLRVRQARPACERVAGSGGPAEPRIASSGRDHVPCFAQCLEFTMLKWKVWQSRGALWGEPAWARFNGGRFRRSFGHVAQSCWLSVCDSLLVMTACRE